MNQQAHILYRDSLLARGLEKLLSGAGVHLHKIDLKGPDPLEMLLPSVQPGDTVLMERQGQSDRSWEEVLRLLSSLPAVALIVVDPSSSQVQVFLQQQCPIDSPEELAKIIRWWGEWGRRLCSGQWE
jgi:hypothetical protein